MIIQFLLEAISLNHLKKLSKFTQTKYCLGVANGNDALEIAIESLDLPNSEIIVPNFTFLSPAEAVLGLDLNWYWLMFGWF